VSHAAAPRATRATRATRAVVAAATAATLLTALPASRASGDIRALPDAALVVPFAPASVAASRPVVAAVGAGSVLTGPVPAGPVLGDRSPVETDLTATSSLPARASVVRIALSRLGRPYRYGAAGPSAFDCSGLTQWAYRQVGVRLPRTSRAQSQVGRPVSRAELQPGDLVFFYHPVSHVAIYIGEGKIVHASTSGSPVKVSNLSGRAFNSARRI